MSRTVRAATLISVLTGTALALTAVPALAAPAAPPGAAARADGVAAAGSDAIGRAGEPPVALSAVARYKAAHDTDPHVRLSAAALKGSAARTESAARAFGARRPEAATSHTLRGTQQAQQTSYWCGPAAVTGALAVRGVSVSQTSSAGLLKTTWDGTDWSGSNAAVPKAYQTGYPVADVLTYKLHAQGAHYYPAGVAYDPTATQKTQYRTRLVNDVNNGWDLVGDAWEVPGGPHLVGHPGNQEIFHFFTMRGYTSSGAYTQYQDSVHGASSISWASGVPAYSTVSSDTVANVVGGRGYVW